MDRARELGLLIKGWRTEQGLGRNEAIDELAKLGVDISYGYLNKLESVALRTTPGRFPMPPESAP